jgi:hypothetical protein
VEAADEGVASVVGEQISDHVAPMRFAGLQISAAEAQAGKAVWQIPAG